MRDPLDRYNEMLMEPVVSTDEFHKILGALYFFHDDEKSVFHMEEMLHIPKKYGPLEWEEYAMQLAFSKRISTVTHAEVMAVELNNEPPQKWEILANRVIEKRKAK